MGVLVVLIVKQGLTRMKLPSFALSVLLVFIVMRYVLLEVFTSFWPLSLIFFSRELLSASSAQRGPFPRKMGPLLAQNVAQILSPLAIELAAIITAVHFPWTTALFTTFLLLRCQLGEIFMVCFECWGVTHDCFVHFNPFL